MQQMSMLGVRFGLMFWDFDSDHTGTKTKRMLYRIV